MHRQMNHKTTIIEVIGHECSQRDRRVYSQRESRLSAFEGKAGGIGEINAPFLHIFLRHFLLVFKCLSHRLYDMHKELKFSIIVQE